MKISQEFARQLADVHNTMATISTTGDDTVKMATCLVGLRNILAQAEIIPATTEQQENAT